MVVVFSFCVPVNCLAISQEQRDAIYEHCEAIRDSLKNVQKIDARTRVFLGSHYETVLSKFIMPLNLRLVENNLSNTGLIDSQSDFATTKSAFSADFVSYQQNLESLIAIDCRAEPEKFYEKLVVVRKKRKAVSLDTDKMRELMMKNIELTERLKEGL